MFVILRRHLLVSTAAIFSLTIAPALVAALSAPLGASVVSSALADSDGGGDDHGGGSDDSGSDHSGSDDHGSGGHGSDDDGSDDHGSDDDSDDDSSDDSSDDASDDSSDDGHGRKGRNNDTRLVVSDDQLAGLQNGTMVAVDQNGRRLKLEIEQEHNQTEVKIKAPRGSVTAVSIVPAN